MYWSRMRIFIILPDTQRVDSPLELLGKNMKRNKTVLRLERLYPLMKMLQTEMNYRAT